MAKETDGSLGRKQTPQLIQVSSCVLLLILQGPTAAPGEKGGIKVSESAVRVLLNKTLLSGNQQLCIP